MTVRGVGHRDDAREMPVDGTRPFVGFSVATPQQWAGKRRLPPESLPMPIALRPAATAAASPLLLPPGVRAASYGLFGRG